MPRGWLRPRHGLLATAGLLLLGLTMGQCAGSSQDGPTAATAVLSTVMARSNVAFTYTIPATVAARFLPTEPFTIATFTFDNTVATAVKPPPSQSKPRVVATAVKPAGQRATCIGRGSIAQIASASSRESLLAKIPDGMTPKTAFVTPDCVAFGGQPGHYIAYLGPWHEFRDAVQACASFVGCRAITLNS